MSWRYIFIVTQQQKYNHVSKNKLSFLCVPKKLILFFLHHHFFIFSFYITHCQHVELLHSGPGTKETFNHLLLTSLTYTEAVTKSFSRKNFLII